MSLLSMATATQIVTAPFVNASFNFDALKEFAPVVNIGANSFVLTTRSSLPAKNVGELIFGLIGTNQLGLREVGFDFGIRHHDGIRLSYSVPGDRAQVRIVGMDGAIASSFTAPATVSDMPLSHKLGRGTYAIEIMGSGERRKARFTVP